VTWRLAKTQPPSADPAIGQGEAGPTIGGMQHAMMPAPLEAVVGALPCASTLLL